MTKGCQFYVISTKKSEELVDGLYQLTLECENRIDAHGFLWIDTKDNIRQIQLLFGELVIEWIAGKGVHYSRTNRATEVPKGIGFHKGVRVLLPVDDSETIESILTEVRSSVFPPEWSKKILEKF